MASQSTADFDTDLRDNEITVPFSPTLSTAPSLPTTQPTDRSLVLRIGCNRFPGSNLAWPSFSPDGSEIVVAGGSETRVFEAATGTLRAILPSAMETLFCDRNTFAQRQYNGINIVSRDGTVLHKLNLLRPEKMAVSHDGKRLAVATAWARPQPAAQGKTPEPHVTLWNLESGEQIADLGLVYHKTQSVRGQPNAYWLLASGTTVAFDANDTLMTVSADAKIKLWNATDGKTKPCADISVDPAMPIAFAPDGKSIMLPENSPRRIDIATGDSTQLPFKLPAASTATTAPTVPPNRIRRAPFVQYGKISFTNDGLILCYARQGIFHRWELKSGKELPAIDRETNGLESSLSPDGRSVAITSFGQLDVFDTDTGHNRFGDSVPRDTVRTMFATRNGSGLIVGDQGGSIYRFDSNTGALQSWRRPTSTTAPSLLPAESFASAPNNEIWAFSTNSTVCRRNAVTLAPTTAPTLLTLVPPYMVSPDGTIAAGYSVDDSYEFEPLAPPALPMTSAQATGNHLRRATNLAISPDHTRLAIAEPYRITIVRADRTDGPEQITDHYFKSPGSRSGEQPAGEKAVDLPAVFSCDFIRYSPDGKTLFGSSRDGPIAFNTGDFTVAWLSSDPLHLPHVRVMAISDDGRLMAVGSDDGISILDTEHGRPVTKIHAPAKPIRAMTFIPGTTRIAVLSDGRSIDICDWRIALTESAGEPSTRPAPSLDAISSDQPADGYAALFSNMERPDDLIQFASTTAKAIAPDPYISLIESLSSSDNSSRERAHQQLERAGIKAAADIRRALAHAPPGEAHDRLQALSDLIDAAGPESDDADPPDDPAVIARRRNARLIEAMELLHTPGATSVLQQFAAGVDSDASLLAKIALTHRAAATTRP